MRTSKPSNNVLRFKAPHLKLCQKFIALSTYEKIYESSSQSEKQLNKKAESKFLGDGDNDQGYIGNLLAHSLQMTTCKSRKIPFFSPFASTGPHSLQITICKSDENPHTDPCFEFIIFFYFKLHIRKLKAKVNLKVNFSKFKRQILVKNVLLEPHISIFILHRDSFNSFDLTFQNFNYSKVGRRNRNTSNANGEKVSSKPEKNFNEQAQK